MRQKPLNTIAYEYKPARRMSKTSFLAEPVIITEENRWCTTQITKDPSWTPSYGQMKKSKIRIPPQPYSHTKLVNYSQWGWRKSETRVGTETWISEERVGMCPWVLASPSLKGRFTSAQSAAIAKATSKFLLQLKDSKFNGAQAYAEADQVYKMIDKFAKTTAEALFYLRQGKLKAAGEVVGLKISSRSATRYREKHRTLKGPADIDKMLANGVLAIQYGVRPLIQDVIGAAELYAQKKVREVVNHVKCGGSYEFSDQWQNEDSSRGLTQYARYAVRCQVTIGSSFGKGDEILHTAKQLGLTNPLLLAWELMPWSFVIDWVLPVGNYLSSLDATLGLAFIDGYMSVKTTANEEWYQTIAKPLPVTGNGSSEHEVSSTSTVREEFERTVLTSFPMPQLPRFKNPVSWEHALNGVALLAGFKKNVYLKQPTD